VGPPDPAVAKIHDRSPIVLGDGALRLWINPLLRPEDTTRVLALPRPTLTGVPVEKVGDDALHPLSP
jgi:putative SOS response-associated peptidase YedK